jgi:hypothetical protein
MLKNKLFDPAFSKVFNTGLPAVDEASLADEDVQLSLLPLDVQRKVNTGRPTPDKSGGLNGSTQHSDRTYFALKTKTKIAR